MAQLVKNLPVMQETQVQSLGGKDPLEKEMATHYSCLENPMDREARWVAKSHNTTEQLSTAEYFCLIPSYIGLFIHSFIKTFVEGLSSPRFYA